MSQSRDTTFNPSSPHSSSGAADSYKHDGTPDTRLTAFSPDDGSARSGKLYTGIGNVSLNAPPANHTIFHQKSTEHFGNVAPAVEKDPFISSNPSPPKSTLDQKLSPTASAFRPLSVPVVAHGSLNGQQGPSNGSQQKFRSMVNITAPLSSRFSSELDITRYVIIFSATTPVTVPEVETYLEKLSQFGSPCQGKRVIFANNGKVYLFLSNIRDAFNIHDNIQLGSQDWRAQYIAAVEFYQARNPGEHHQQVSDGLLRVIAFPQESAHYDLFHTNTVVRTLMESHGEVLAFHQVSGMKEIPFQAMVEFCDCDVAIAAAEALNGRTCNGVYLTLISAQPDATSRGFQPLEGPRANNSPVQDMTNIFQNMGVSKPVQQQQIVPPGRLAHSPAGGIHMPPQQMAMYPTVVYHGLQHNMPPRYVLDHTPTRSQGITPMSPMTPMTGGMPVMAPLYTPPATPMAFHHGDYTSPRGIQPYARLDGRRQNAMRVNRSPYYNAAGHHNHVDVNKIRDGIDVRTTIMLRNIPNKVDQAMLKRIVDESSWGKYDFMYLRIDFANDCNVGYAFINFVDPLDIIDFVNARGNQRWNCFKSDKVAEISYATIQGKDCLVQKFRNSSVMLEAPHYRPKLYFTLNGPRPDLAGNEEPFPEPDNQSKMKRSCENAEHVGLFTPNAGQHFRDEQRRRRSQYDRGTRLAALEEYDYDSHIQQPSLYMG
ncbi:RNA recognition motif 2-domain-containing protein [Apiosordaria backusii]|uniref:RNA recognition motif 2-domain-containing protein n=1 Tax=Apiosordaria backusii TaxID=314023 RepID=A0AA40BMV5_9PEZI|nr:RNA recognition motif 2-domain-containing protein [Apiosordaria backusii]